LSLENRNTYGILLIIFYIVFSFVITIMGYSDLKYWGLVILGILELALSFYYVMSKDLDKRELIVEVLTSATILAVIAYVYLRFLK